MWGTIFAIEKAMLAISFHDHHSLK